MNFIKKQAKITLTKTVQRNQEMLTSNIGEEIVMMSIDNSAYYGLDPIGSNIWEMLAEPIRVSDLCAQLMQRYEVNEQDCQRDVLNFLNQMRNEDLLTVL